MQQCVVVVALCLVACVLVQGERGADRRRNEGRNTPRVKQGQAACQFEFGPCQLLNSSATCGVGKKLGTAQNQKCPVTEKQMKCKISCGCKYKPVRGENGASTGCDRDTKKREIKQELISGDPSSCPNTKIVYKKCKMAGNKNSRGSREVRPGGKKNGGEGRAADRKKGTTVPPETDIQPIAAAGKNAACKYRRGVKSECDPVTMKRTITLELKKKSPATCAPTKTMKKDCKVKVKGERPNRKGSNGFF